MAFKRSQIGTEWLQATIYPLAMPTVTGLTTTPVPASGAISPTTVVGVLDRPVRVHVTHVLIFR